MSSGFRRSDQGSHSGARSASSPGSRAVSATVANFARGARASTATQDQPRYPGMVHSNTCVTRRSALASARRCCPIWPGSVTSSSASRARSTASAAIASSLGRAVRRRVAVVGDVMSGLEIVGDGAQHGGDLLRVPAVGIPALAEAVGSIIEQADEVLDHAGHLVGLGATSTTDRGSGLHQLQGQHLGAAAPVDHVELDPGSRTQGGDPLGQGRGVHVDALTVLVVEDETEALLGVVELHLAAWHVDPVPIWCSWLPGLWGPLSLLVLGPGGAFGWSRPTGVPATVRRRSSLQPAGRSKWGAGTRWYGCEHTGPGHRDPSDPGAGAGGGARRVRGRGRGTGTVAQRRRAPTLPQRRRAGTVPQRRRAGTVPQRRRSAGISRTGASSGTGSRPSPVSTCSTIIAVNPHTRAPSGRSKTGPTGWPWRIPRIRRRGSVSEPAPVSGAHTRRSTSIGSWTRSCGRCGAQASTGVTRWARQGIGISAKEPSTLTSPGSKPVSS